jgi:hypothetical protein
MTDLEQKLTDRGFSPDDITTIVDVIEEQDAGTARQQAAQLLHLVFIRVGRDSAAGCALRRALGFSGGLSLARAAGDFLVSKQYLEDLQSKLEAQLGDLSFLARQARDTPLPPSTGPSGGSAGHR